MVKHYFRPDIAGLYAAIALVGRLLYFAAWSVVSAMFPVSAEGTAEKSGRALLALPLHDGDGHVHLVCPGIGGISDFGFPVLVRGELS